MNINKKILILVNDLSFLISHRLPIAKASIAKGFEVVIGYGELGGANPKILEQIGIKTIHVPIHRGGINLFKELLLRINKFR